jgi:hypothetical protein
LREILLLIEGERSAKPLKFQFHAKWRGVRRIFQVKVIDSRDSHPKNSMGAEQFGLKNLAR